MTRPTPTLQYLVPTAIEVRDRLRKVLPRRVEALRPDIADKGVEQPIEVVETSALPRLVYGAHRLAAVIAEGLPSIPALVYPEGAFGSEHEIRMREISENFFRFELTALERAVNIAEWRIAHEALHPPAKPGPKAKVGTDEAMMELSANFALNFTEVVQQTLGLSRRAVFLALKVARIAAAAASSVRPRMVDERALDVLLMPVAGKNGQRTVTAQGIRIDGYFYGVRSILPKEQVFVRMDPRRAGACAAGNAAHAIGRARRSWRALRQETAGPLDRRLEPRRGARAP